MSSARRLVGYAVAAVAVLAVVALAAVVLLPRGTRPQDESPKPRDEKQPVWARPPPPPVGVDAILDRLALGNLAFNAPSAMNVGDTAMVDLVLGLEAPIEDLERMIEPEGQKEGARIRVSDRMEARLSGPDFTITGITPEVQAVSRTALTRWQWEVKPNGSGSQHLHLTLSALLTVEGTPTPRALRTFDRTITVEVTWGQRATTFLAGNWQWLWAAILVPVVTWLWQRRARKNTKGHGPRPHAGHAGT